MEIVALFLQTKAASCRRGSEEFDLFGRSSFNRYYYAAFLRVREILGQMNENWYSIDHAAIPGLLTGQVLTTVRRHASRAKKIGDKEATDICGRAAAAAHDLAELMTAARAVRTAADYNPQIPIEPDAEGRFRLLLVSITVAHEWPNRAKVLGDKIKRAWNLLDD